MTGYLAKLKEETCGARPRETLVKRAFAPSGGMRLRPRQPFIPASSAPAQHPPRGNREIKKPPEPFGDKPRETLVK